MSPVVCVDKSPDELSDFTALVAESKRSGATWEIVFVGALSGKDGNPPSADETENSIQMMIESILQGGAGRFMAFDVEGNPVSFS